MKTRYLYLEIDEAMTKAIYKQGFLPSGFNYNKLSDIISKLVEYKKELSIIDIKDLASFNKLCKKFDSFRKRNFFYIFD